MGRPRSVYLLGLAAPLLLLQLIPTSCLPTGGDGTGGGGRATNLPPTVIISADVQRGVAPLNVQFSSSGSTDDGVIIRRLWEFGDGATSEEISPLHTYERNGDFTVELTLTDDLGASASRSLIVSVTERPVPILTVDRTAAESAPAVFYFDGSASYDPDAKPEEELTYEWDFGDGSQEVLPVVQHTYGTPGQFRVRLTVTDAVGVAGSVEKIIAVGIPEPSISFRAPPPEIRNIVAASDAPLWVQAVFQLQPGVPYRLRAGLDGDRDICSGQVLLVDPRTATVLDSLTDPIAQPERQQGPVRAAVFSPNGANVLAGGDDGLIRLYDVNTGGLLRVYPGTGAGVTALAFDPSSATFAAGYADGTLVRRDLGSETITQAFTGKHTVSINAVVFSPDGTLLLSGDNGGLAVLWNAALGTAVFDYNHGAAAVYDVAFSPTNPQRVATASADNYARAWSTVNGLLAQEFGPVFNNGVQVAGHSAAVRSVTYSNDGTLLLTAGADRLIKIWRVTTGREEATLAGHEAGVNAATFSPDNQQVLSGADDGVLLIWSLQTVNPLQSVQACTSPITAVSYDPAGTRVLAAIAAANDIQLDTNPSQGNDLNLTLPTALDLSGVPVNATGEPYYLWIEVDTDQTAPARTYSDATIFVVPPLPSDLSEPQTVPAVVYRPIVDPVSGKEQEVASVLVAPAALSRQVVNLGPLDVGDRLYISFLTTPGYTNAYTDRELDPLIVEFTSLFARQGFSLLILDSIEQMYAWYGAERTFFSPDSKLIIGHSSPAYFAVLSGIGSEPAPSINVRIQRQYADNSAPRAQYVHLNFLGAPQLSIQGSSLFTVPSFDIPGRPPTSVTTVRSAIVSRIQQMFAPYNVTVATTPPANSAEPRLTIYFDCVGNMMTANIPDRDGTSPASVGDLQFWGLPNYIDPRNETLSGKAVVEVGEILDVPEFEALADAELGTLIGNATVHQIGLLTGLRETEEFGAATDIMTTDYTVVDNAGLVFTTAPLAPIGTAVPLGDQNAPQLLLELFGGQ
ncbi:MAG: PKD domain-containing protein [Planctomycetota bacterium]